MVFSNRERNKSTLDTLTKALANRDKTVINTGSVTAPYSSNQTSTGDSLSGASNLLTGGMKLYGGLKDSGLFGGNSASDGLGIFGNAANDSIMGGGESYGIFGDAANSSIMGTGAESAGIFGDAANSSIMGDSAGGGTPIGLIMGGIRAGQKGLSGGDWKDEVPQAFFGIDSEGSDTSQALSGAAKGAIMGLPFGGPIGAAIGGVLGLGASFLDDI